MSDEYVDPDEAAARMYEEASKPDGEQQPVKADDQQEQVEDKAEEQSGEEAAEEQESEDVTSEEDKSKAKAKDEEPEDEDEEEDPKRVRIGKWSPLDRRAATIAAKAGIPLARALEIAKEQLGVTDEADSDAEPEIPDAVAQIRSTLEEKRAKLTEITTKLDASDEDYELTAKDIRKLSKEETDLKLEIQRLEIQEGQEQADYERRTAYAASFGERWDDAVLRGLEEFPDADVADSRLSDAMHVAMDKFSADKNHKYKGNPEAPYLILKEVAARLGVKSAKESQSDDKGTEQAKATQKPAQKAGYRPMQGSAATAAKSASQEGITQEAVAKALQEGGPEAVAALYDADIYSGSKAANRGLGFAIA